MPEIYKACSADLRRDQIAARRTDHSKNTHGDLGVLAETSMSNNNLI